MENIELGQVRYLGNIVGIVSECLKNNMYSVLLYKDGSFDKKIEMTKINLLTLLPKQLKQDTKWYTKNKLFEATLVEVIFTKGEIYIENYSDSDGKTDIDRVDKFLLEYVQA